MRIHDNIVCIDVLARGLVGVVYCDILIHDVITCYTIGSCIFHLIGTFDYS